MTSFALRMAQCKTSIATWEKTIKASETLSKDIFTTVPSVPLATSCPGDRFTVASTHDFIKYDAATATITATPNATLVRHIGTFTVPVTHTRANGSSYTKDVTIIVTPDCTKAEYVDITTAPTRMNVSDVKYF